MLGQTLWAGGAAGDGGDGAEESCIPPSRRQSRAWGQPDGCMVFAGGGGPLCIGGFLLTPLVHSFLHSPQPCPMPGPSPEQLLLIHQPLSLQVLLLAWGSRHAPVSAAGLSTAAISGKTAVAELGCVTR